MDALMNLDCLVEQVLREQTLIPYAHGDVQNYTIFDRENARYAVMVSGYNGYRRVHYCLSEVDIIDGKLWIQRDGTEHGIANDFLAAGMPKDKIVLAFLTPVERKFGEFAVA